MGSSASGHHSSVRTRGSDHAPHSGRHQRITAWLRGCRDATRPTLGETSVGSGRLSGSSFEAVKRKAVTSLGAVVVAILLSACSSLPSSTAVTAAEQRVKSLEAAIRTDTRGAQAECPPGYTGSCTPGPAVLKLRSDKAALSQAQRALKRVQPPN